MKPAFILICMMSGIPEKNGKMFLSSINNCVYFRDYMTKQSVTMKNKDGKVETKMYECICKLTKVPEETRLY
jgi:hypothetical protein